MQSIDKAPAWYRRAMGVLNRAAGRLFERFPVLGVITGAGMVLGFGGLGASSAVKCMRFDKQPHPATVAEAVAKAGDTNWVTLTDAQWHCDRAITTSDDQGRVDRMYVPATGADGGSFVLISFDKSVDCAANAAQPVTGVLHPLHPRLRANLEQQGANFSDLPGPGYSLSTFLGPSDSRIGIWFGGAFALVGAGVIWAYLRKMRAR